MNVLLLALLGPLVAQETPRELPVLRESSHVVADSIGAGLGFGGSIALQGDRALVSDGPGSTPSRVLELRLGPKGISKESVLLPEEPAERGSFGYDLAWDGDRALIGAPSGPGGRRAAA